MTKRRVGVSSGNWFEGSQVSKARPGAPFDFSLSILQRAQALSFLSRLASESRERNDKKERVVVKRGQLLKEGAVANGFPPQQPP
jgi:hypothetical protein